jgi:hypothetical protein
MALLENIKHLLLPKFLKRFDRKLILNNPVAWSARAHLVSWFGLLSTCFLALLFLIIPNDPRHDSTVYLPIFFIAILSVVGIIFYLIYLLRFNVFKRFGAYTRASMLSSFLLIFTCLGFIISQPFIPSIVESYRANRAFSSEELVKDTDRMNFLISELLYDSLIVDFSRDTVLLSNAKVFKYCDENGFKVENFYNDTINICTQSYLLNQISEHDSVLSLRNQTYVLLDAPDYEFLNCDKARRYISKSKLSRLERYYNVHRSFNKDSLSNWSSEFKKLKVKYASNEVYYNTGWEYAHTSLGSSYLDILGVRSIEEGLDNISFRKFFWYDDTPEILFRVWFYISLGLSLLLFIFRHSTTKIFFISLLVAVLLLMLSGLFVAFLGLEEIGILNLMLFYIATFCVLSSKTFKSLKKSRLTGVSLNIFAASIGFVPIIIVFLYYAHLREKYRNTNFQIDYDYTYFAFNLQWAEVVGIILLLIMIPTFLYSCYRKWYALPDE